MSIVNCELSIVNVNYYNPTMDYKHFMIPALMIMLMVMVGGFLPALNLVSEKDVLALAGGNASGRVQR